MSTSRKDFIQIAEGCISAIKSGYVKKKDIYSFINTMAGACKMTNHNFDCTEEHPELNVYGN